MCWVLCNRDLVIREIPVLYIRPFIQQLIIAGIRPSPGIRREEDSHGLATPSLTRDTVSK